MSDQLHSLAIQLFSEVLGADQSLRSKLAQALPKGMEISHFSVLNSLAFHGQERTPAQLAEALNVTRGAMTNTLSKLTWSGFVHIRPDWDDARRKLVMISPAGRLARDTALSGITPMIHQVVAELGEERVRATLPILRAIRENKG